MPDLLRAFGVSELFGTGGGLGEVSACGRHECDFVLRAPHGKPPPEEPPMLLLEGS